MQFDLRSNSPIIKSSNTYQSSITSPQATHKNHFSGTDFLQNFQNKPFSREEPVFSQFTSLKRDILQNKSGQYVQSIINNLNFAAKRFFTVSEKIKVAAKTHAIKTLVESDFLSFESEKLTFESNLLNLSQMQSKFYLHNISTSPSDKSRVQNNHFTLDSSENQLQKENDLLKIKLDQQEHELSQLKSQQKLNKSSDKQLFEINNQQKYLIQLEKSILAKNIEMDKLKERIASNDTKKERYSIKGGLQAKYPILAMELMISCIEKSDSSLKMSKYLELAEKHLKLVELVNNSSDLQRNPMKQMVSFLEIELNDLLKFFADLVSRRVESNISSDCLKQTQGQLNQKIFEFRKNEREEVKSQNDNVIQNFIFLSRKQNSKQNNNKLFAGKQQTLRELECSQSFETSLIEQIDNIRIGYLRHFTDMLSEIGIYMNIPKYENRNEEEDIVLLLRSEFSKIANQHTGHLALVQELRERIQVQENQLFKSSVQLEELQIELDKMINEKDKSLNSEEKIEEYKIQLKSQIAENQALKKQISSFHSLNGACENREKIANQIVENIRSQLFCLLDNVSSLLKKFRITPEEGKQDANQMLLALENFLLRSADEQKLLSSHRIVIEDLETRIAEVTSNITRISSSNNILESTNQDLKDQLKIIQEQTNSSLKILMDQDTYILQLQYNIKKHQEDFRRLYDNQLNLIEQNKLFNQRLSILIQECEDLETHKNHFESVVKEQSQEILYQQQILIDFEKKFKNNQINYSSLFGSSVNNLLEIEQISLKQQQQKRDFLEINKTQQEKINQINQYKNDGVPSELNHHVNIEKNLEKDENNQITLKNLGKECIQQFQQKFSTNLQKLHQKPDINLQNELIAQIEQDFTIFIIFLKNEFNNKIIQLQNKISKNEILIQKSPQNGSASKLDSQVENFLKDQFYRKALDNEQSQIHNNQNHFQTEENTQEFQESSENQMNMNPLLPFDQE